MSNRQIDTEDTTALRVPKRELSPGLGESMIYVVRNPRKLTRLDEPAELAR